MLLALVGGVVGTTLGLIETKPQKRRAESRALEARRQVQIALAEAAAKEMARRLAERLSTQNEKISEILGSMFTDLDLRKVEKDGKPLVALWGERLDQASAQTIGDPLEVARMQMTLGASQFGLLNTQKAINLFTKSQATFSSQLGPDHPDTLVSMNNLAHSYQAAGQFDRATSLLRVVADKRNRRDGSEAPPLWFHLASPCSNKRSGSKPSRYCVRAWQSTSTKKPTLGRRSIRSRCSARRCSGRGSTTRPGRFWWLGTRG